MKTNYKTLLKVLNVLVLLIFLRLECLGTVTMLEVKNRPGQEVGLNYLFESGNEGYQCFRIPVIVNVGDGILLAFAEGRVNGCSDTGDIDLVMKRSEDGGKTWSPLQVIWNDGENVCGNPAPVYDKQTGKVYLLSTWNLGEDHESEIIKQTSNNTRRVFVMRSDDKGINWSQPLEITSSVKKENWTWYATGPCHGIQLENSKYEGRLVIPCDHIEAGTKKYYSHTIYSDDHGKTWELGGTTPQDQVNECTVAELSDGQLILNMRNYDRTQKVRKISYSSDGGESWSNIRSDISLIEPICQASLITVNNGRKMYFSNPSSESSRSNMLLKSSDDGGKNWEIERVLHSGPSAYSDIVEIEENIIGCLFEAGWQNPYQGIVFKIAILGQ